MIDIKNERGRSVVIGIPGIVGAMMTGEIANEITVRHYGITLFSYAVMYYMVLYS